MDVVWLNRFNVNRFETGLSASVNGANAYLKIQPWLKCHN